MPHILLIEDEPKLAQLMVRYLEKEEYAHAHLADGNDVMPWLASHQTDLILLDLNLPNRDGLTLCREIRAQRNTPVIMTTARVDEIDRLLGLELGADDYVCKPYSPRELIARIKAVLRRTQPVTLDARALNAAANTSITHAMTPQFNDEKLQATFAGCPLTLTLVEYQLLKILAASPGRIFSRDQLMDRIYPDQRIVNDRTIDSHIKKLRRKLENALPDHTLIHAVYGAGYKYELT